MRTTTRAGALLVAGTTSDAGKTAVSTGLCRALVRRGLAVAPYKAQNMSNNSMVTADGAEIGRAQWVQAVAARAEPEPAMNPVLLKPGSDLRSHVVLMGRPHGTLEAGEFAVDRRELAEAAFAAFDDLRSRFDVVVCEGAGSPAEINLRTHDYVNMGLARHGAVPTVVVGDIDRGGVLAALYGTLALLDAEDQALVSGFVVNKFRGDLALLRPGLRQVEELTGRPVLGVLPWLEDLWLDSEDSLSLPGPRAASSDQRTLSVAVVAFPRTSNATDIDALALEPSVDVRLVRDPRGLAGADLVVLPGTRATLADLAWLRGRGLADAVAGHAARGGAVLGICGGYQMLGRTIEDPAGVEGTPGAGADGLRLLDARTVFECTKVLDLPTGRWGSVPVTGYQIHHGRVDPGEDGPFPGGSAAGRVQGTLWHGCLEGEAFRRAWLQGIADAAGASYLPATPGFAAAREARIDALADAVEQHLDVGAILRLVEDGAPAGLPLLTGGLIGPPGVRTPRR